MTAITNPKPSRDPLGAVRLVERLSLAYTMIDIKEIKQGSYRQIVPHWQEPGWRLPCDYRFDGDEVYIRKDAATGDVILSRRPDSWDGFFALADPTGIAEGFMAGRHDPPPQRRKLFG